MSEADPESPDDDLERSPISEVDLGSPGEELGTGGQATVHALTEARSHQVLKLYKPDVAVDVASLDASIAWRDALSEDDRRFLDERSCWPVARVTAEDEEERTVGVVLNRLPEHFTVTLRSGRVRPRELQFLFLVERTRKLGVDVPEPPGRVAVLAELAKLLAFFDRNDIVHGDLSMKNVLWLATGPEGPTGAEGSDGEAGNAPGVYLLDCDGARVGNQPPPLPIVTTRGWTDPRLITGQIDAPDAQSEIYALALSFYRCYYGHVGDLDEDTVSVRIPTFPPADPQLLQMLAASLAIRRDRPPISEWLEALTRLGADLDNPESDLGRQYQAGPGFAPEPLAHPQPGPISEPAEASQPPMHHADTSVEPDRPPAANIGVGPSAAGGQPPSDRSTGIVWQSPAPDRSPAHSPPPQPLTHPQPQSQPQSQSRSQAPSTSSAARIVLASSIGLLIGSIVALIVVFLVVSR